MRHILHFAQDDDTSGFFPQLARWHDRSCYKVSFATLNPMAPWLRAYMEEQDVDCLSCDCRGRWDYPVALLRLAYSLRVRRVDILHTHLFEPSIIGLTAGVLARTPMRVLTRHYSDYHTRIDKRWHVRLDRLCTRLSHAVIAVSQHTADHMAALEGAPRSKLFPIPNGIDFDRVRLSSPNAAQRIRHEVGIGDGHLLLVVARLHPEKGYQYLFEAMARLRSRLRQPVVLLVAGKGSFEHAYREQVRALGCEDMVRFLGFRRDIADLMAAADLLVLPSVAEAFGLVVTEALSLGTPVVASRVGGIPEIVRDGVDGILVPPADVGALAAALARLLTEPQLRHSLAGAGRDRVRQQFSFERMVRAYESVYDEFLSIAGKTAHARSLNCDTSL